MLHEIKVATVVKAIENALPFKHQFHKMVKHTKTIRRQFADELSMFGHFVGLALKGLNAPKVSFSYTAVKRSHNINNVLNKI